SYFPADHCLLLKHAFPLWLVPLPDLHNWWFYPLRLSVNIKPVPCRHYLLFLSLSFSSHKYFDPFSIHSIASKNARNLYVILSIPCSDKAWLSFFMSLDTSSRTVYISRASDLRISRFSRFPTTQTWL